MLNPKALEAEIVSDGVKLLARRYHRVKRRKIVIFRLFRTRRMLRKLREIVG